MLPNKALVVCLVLPLILASSAQSLNLEDISRTLDELLVGVRSPRRPRDREDTSSIWQKYEFGTGAGNREEVEVTNITLHRYADIPETNDWQFLQTENAYFICAEGSTLLFYEVDLNDLSIKLSANVTTEGRILRFKVFDLKVEEMKRKDYADDLMAVLFVGSEYGYFLYWYRVSENATRLYSKLSVQHEYRDMEIVRKGDQNELLLLNNNVVYLGQSSIDVYGFHSDYSNHRIDIWFCRRLYIPETSDVQVCPFYDSTILALQTNDSIVLYVARDDDVHCKYEEFEVIETKQLANFVCFESGYIEYLAIAARKARLFHFFENEFQDNAETSLLFDGIIEEVSWITAVPLHTYRDESLLLVQFENLTEIALAWQGSYFKQVLLPSQIMDDFDLSRVVVVPKVGFMHGNTLVRIDVILRELAYPAHSETESMLKTRILLEDVFRTQEAILDKTEAQVNQSYLKNPVTGFWNLSRANVSDVATGKDVKYGAIKVGTMDLQPEDMSTNVMSSLKKLEELEAKLDPVLSNMKDTDNVYTMKIVLQPDVKINADFLVNGTLHAKNVTAAFVNNASTLSAPDSNTNPSVDLINGRKSFPSVDTDNLTVVTLNGIPLEEYVFDNLLASYDDVDFSRPKRLEIDGHLNFSQINDVVWDKLMQNIVWKNENKFIPGDTIVKGQLIVDEGIVAYLNNLRYPQDYVPSRSKITVNVTGEKYFSNLSVINFVNVSMINDIDDFIVLNRDELLDREIIFEDLQIDEILQIDGNVTGINVTKLEGTLNEINMLNTDAIFENLIVVGDIVLRDSIDAKTWSDFDDLLLKTESNATITGNKKFSSEVTLKSNIRTGSVNGHAVSEFVTLDTDQQFPYLKSISASVTFGDVNLGAVNKLKDYVTREQSISSGCINKVLLFMKTPIVDKISFETIEHRITSEAFFERLNKTFRKAYFERLTLSTLRADEITPKMINAMWNYSDLMKLTASTRQNLTGSLVVDNLEISVLDAKLVNGMLMHDFNRLLTRAKSLYDDVFSGNATLQSLRVTGVLTASSINGRDVLDIYDERSMRPVIFQRDVTIENLTVLDFVNGRNLSKFVDDAVRKTDRNITYTGKKTFGNVTCEFLDVRFVNGHFVDDILDPEREQVLRGPVVVNGSITVLESFNTTGKIGAIFLSDFIDRIKPLGNNSYALRGDFRFTGNTSVARLDVSGPVEGMFFDNFLQRTIAKSHSNVTISGTKLFKKLIIFNDRFTIDGVLDDLELFKFREKAVYIDKPFSIDSKVVFKEGIYLRKNVLVKKKLQTSSIMGVDMKDLRENAIPLDAPVHFGERMTLDNVTSQASVKVVQVNDLKMHELIPLHTDQLILIETLMCIKVTYKHIHLRGHVNNYVLNNIYADTFTVDDDQNVTGIIKIRGNVYAYKDFNVHYINGFKLNQIISTNANETLIGNFTFKDTVILDKSLRILGLLNGIDPINWEGTAVMKTSKTKQIIHGKWRVHGNVTFEKNINGSEFLNKINIMEASIILAKERVELYSIIKEINENLDSICEILNVLECRFANQLYKFDTFEYLKILEFEGDIHNIRNIDLDNLGYLLVNHGNCSVTLLQYTSTNFIEADKVFDVGLVDQWTFYRLNRTIYMLTIAKRACGRNLNNIWKLENGRLTHMLELGNVTNFMRTYQNTFIAMNHDETATVPESNLQSSILEALVSYEQEKLNSILYNEPIMPTNQTFVYEVQGRSLNGMHPNDCFNCSSLLNYKVGIFKKEVYVYYNEEISQNHIYFLKDDASQTRILQIIKAHRPKSFLVLNFDGSVETLLIFIENNEAIRVYEYRGIEGFVYRNSIKMKVDQLYKFQMRKYTYMKKKHYLAAVNGDRLTILEAKMHGEKLDLTTLTSSGSCPMNACPTR
ncbi:uncharacterized protein LOC105183598 [Harpegnathos saltator]|uniref:Uncharacterized protein n=1 Tax=Harpegnathos saltator TaxID=610380 RepID=E2BJR2_HARSA|nr:uncharacterized protein LOC105183598 [Harpegnathos saltator]XP_019697211.1 uncharacterized protein LOC105183598 [Harpegnathos saltator]EFN84070.1 hypothetical protein EAI_08350 [Harpegnathos saltator]